MMTSAGFAVVSPLLIRQAIDGLEHGFETGLLAYTALALVGFAALRSLLVFRGRFHLVAASRLVEYDLRNDLYRRLLRLPASFFDRHSSGDLASRVINDLEGVRMLAGVAVNILAGTALLLVFSLAAMLSIHPRLALLCMIPLVLVALVTALMMPRIYARSREVQERLSSLSDMAHENFSGARVVRAFAQESAERDRFAAVCGTYRDSNIALARTRGGTWAAMTFFIEASLLVMLLAGGSAILSGSLTRGEFVAFTVYQFMLVWPVIAVGWVISLFQRGAACMERLSEILDAPAEEDAPSPENPPPRRGSIEFRGLTFSYQPDRPPALRDLSLLVRPGERVAVVGRTGAGKTTLLQILLGLHPVPRGTVFLDGRDINDYPRRALRDAIGCVPQDTFLFSDPLRANIAFGGIDGVDDARIRTAAEISRISEDARTFPDGLDQVIGERGITLSGGQKQRTALARAVVRDPALLLLDDSFSSVDVQTEQEILDRLHPFLGGRTCLMATHRFSLLRLADRILVLDEGRVVEEGKRENLIRRGGIYAKLEERQRLAETLSRS